ncbi:MAG: pro-sigmaK processing inhibitor BofA family protein [Oscillospiraceae bacterium]|nr:pro-sigmaK processing inhibitor BofA family protein [Oscillospiraceae bacterium]
MLFVIAVLVVCAAALFMNLRFLSKAKRPGLAALKSAAGGIASLLAVNSLASFTGVALTLNYVTVCVCALLGLPGTLLLLFVRLLVH